MERVNMLLADKEYKELLERLEELEKDRSFCSHGMEHLLAVARIAWIRNLEEDLGLEKEAVYLSALLHDLGRVDEYQRGIPHQEAGRNRASYFLEKLGYPPQKRGLILDAVEGHRRRKAGEKGLASLVAEADKASRDCGYCKAYDDCKWSPEEKNHSLER